MAVVLFTWELGGGLGHVMQMAPLAAGLVERGHRVFAAVKDLAAARGVFGEGVAVLPAPAPARPPLCKRTTNSFADVLEDCCFGDDRTLAALSEAWRNLYRLTRPDLIVFDHSPTALLACRGVPARRVVLGTGYLAPPDVHPFPVLRPGARVNPRELSECEARMLDRINRVLRSWNHRPLERLGQLYREVDRTFLTTFAELDPYAALRPAGTRYWGPANATGGAAPLWPAGEGKRVFCYLRAFEALPALLEFLIDAALPTLAFGDFDARTRERFASPTLRFVSEPLDLAVVGRESDVQILNAGHGSVCAALLAGRPSLLLPLHLEQALNARAVRRMGAGLGASVRDGPTLVERLQKLLADDSYAQAARRFGGRHAAFDPRHESHAIVEQLCGLIS